MPAAVEYLTTKEAAAFLRRSKFTLERWRSEGGGPAYSKPGNIVLYDPADLNAFINSKRRTKTRGGE